MHPEFLGQGNWLPDYADMAVEKTVMAVSGNFSKKMTDSEDTQSKSA